MASTLEHTQAIHPVVGDSIAHNARVRVAIHPVYPLLTTHSPPPNRNPNLTTNPN